MEAIAVMVTAHTMAGAGVTYLGPVGAPLRCDRPDNPLVYSKATVPWVAFSDAQFKSKRVQCGDLAHVLEYLPDGTTRSFMARVHDSGSFGDHTQIGGLPIVVDGPPHVVSWSMYPGWGAMVRHLRMGFWITVALPSCQAPAYTSALEVRVNC